MSNEDSGNQNVQPGEGSFKNSPNPNLNNVKKEKGGFFFPGDKAGGSKLKIVLAGILVIFSVFILFLDFSKYVEISNQDIVIIKGFVLIISAGWLLHEIVTLREKMDN